MIKTFNEQYCRDYDGFIKKALKLQQRGNWIFRGHKTTDWKLQTKFERVCDRFEIRASDRPRIEKNMVREFQRRLHHYTGDVPDKGANDEWMALMQHHGAPTRLLDFTYSPYVAAYFAFENAEADKHVAVWAVNVAWCEERLEQLDEGLAAEYARYGEDRKPKSFDVIFMHPDNRHRLVLTVNPFRLNERLAYQRGVFLCPGDVAAGFMENLSDFSGDEQPKDQVIQFAIPTGAHNKNTISALKQLDLMNINRIALFPGLDGFAQSFSTRIPTIFIQQYGHE